MALTADFWRKDEQLDIFRSKVCTRLSRDGVCQWKSQCQFSHCIEWPRRPPSKHTYSPEVCPNLKAVVGQDGAPVLTNTCTGGRSCPYAHSMEEVLFHPLIFKTTKCEEHSSLKKDSEKRKPQKHGKKRCHRYYCPFAHGDQELRASSLDAKSVQEFLNKLDMFPSGDCCKVCVQPFCTSKPPSDNMLRPYQENMFIPPILATAPQPWSDLMALQQVREQAVNHNLKDEISSGLMPSPIMSPFAALTPVPPLFKENREDNLPMKMDPPLTIHMDGSIAKLCIANHASREQKQVFRFDQKEARRIESQRIYDML